VLHYITSYNGLYNGFFKTLTGTSQGENQSIESIILRDIHGIFFFLLLLSPSFFCLQSL